MPTYVYACKACDHQFEKSQSFTANALRKCPNCGEKALSKVIFPAGVVFKGAGFYVNDSKTSSSSTGTQDTASESTGSSDTADSKKEPARSKKSDSKTPSKTKESTKSKSDAKPS